MRNARLTRARAEIRRRQQVAKNATPGPWKIARIDESDRAVTIIRELWSVPARREVLSLEGPGSPWGVDAALFVDNDPTFILAMLSIAQGVLRDHKPQMYAGQACCSWCIGADEDPDPFPCPIIAPWLDLLAPEPK